LQNVSALSEQAWLHYLTAQEYPEWLAAEGHIVIKRPVGRPRKHPQTIPFEERLKQESE
jgi:hypothetical protein